MIVVFAHGLEGSPQGRKSTALREAGLEPIVPDGTEKVLSLRVQDLVEVTAPGDVVLVGSSYGGLAAALVAARYPDRFRALVLCAPALEFREPPNLEPLALVAPRSIPTHILHGTGDTVVPLAWSRRYRDRSGPHVVLEEVDDDHSLGASIPRLVAVVAGFARGQARRDGR